MAPRLPLTRFHSLLILGLAVFAVYGRTLPYGLVHFDDSWTLQGAGSRTEAKSSALSLLKQLKAAPARLLRERPLRTFSVLADAWAFDGDLRAMRAVNIVLHALAAWAAYFIALELLQAPFWALFAALLFALHPLQTESVVYLAGRRDTLFGCLTLWSFFAYLRRSSGGAWPWAAACGVLWLLALLTKPAALTLPFICLAHGIWMRRWKLQPGAAPASYAAGAAVLIVISAVIASHIQGAGLDAVRYNASAADFWYGGSAGMHWLALGRALIHGIELFIFPWTLRPDYSWQVFSGGAAAAACWLILAAAGFLFIRARKSEPLTGFSVLWIVLAYLPMLPVLPTLHNDEFFAEHWLYLPLFGAALLAARLLERFAKSRPQAALAAAMILLLAAAGRTVVRSADWRDDLSLWSKSAADSPLCSRTRLAHGNALLRRGEFAAAGVEFAAAVSARPDWAEPYSHLARLHLRDGKPEEARRLAQAALALPSVGPVAPRLHYVEAMAYYMEGRLPQARLHLDRAIQSSRGFSVEALDARAYLAEKSNPGPAGILYERALALDPRYAPALNNYGRFLARRGEIEKARGLFERAAALNFEPAMRALAELPPGPAKQSATIFQ